MTQQTTTITDIRTDLDAAPADPDEHEPEAHIVRQEDIAHAMAAGVKVRALCGKQFDATIFWPAGLPVCQACLNAYDRLMAARAGRN